MVAPLLTLLALWLPPLLRLLLSSPLNWVRSGGARTAPPLRVLWPATGPMPLPGETAMKLGYTILYVDDVESSIAFCERAFGLKRGFVHESGGYGELVTGETTLAFAQHATARENLGQAYVRADESTPPLGMEVGLLTNDVEAAWQRALQAGATPTKPPTRKPWGQTVAYVRCPDGLLVELCTPMD